MPITPEQVPELIEQLRTKRREASRKWYAANRAKKLAQNKAWNLANRERHVQMNRDYYAANRDRKLSGSRRYYAANKEYYDDIHRQWREKNADKVAAIKHRRRAREAGVTGEWTSDDVAQIKILQKGKCAVCSVKLGDDYHRDHIKPIAKGGNNSRNNLQLLCPPCNWKKNARDPVEFMQSRGFLL